MKKIKANLIKAAKIKKGFAKIKARAEQEQLVTNNAAQPTQSEAIEPASLDPHPDRQVLMDESLEPVDNDDELHSTAKRRQRQKTDPFSREAQEAKRKREAAEQRQREREGAQAQRQKKMEERERMRRAMPQARKPGRDGKRKLGRESAVLLERVKKLVNGT